MTESFSSIPETELPVETPTATPTAAADDAPIETTDESIDLDHIESDLAGVEQALARLAEGTYWTDEVTGDSLPDALLEADPIARRVAHH